jgi:hypothetical protein
MRRRFRFPAASVESGRASLPHRPLKDGLAHPADTSTNLASASPCPGGRKHLLELAQCSGHDSGVFRVLYAHTDVEQVLVVGGAYHHFGQRPLYSRVRRRRCLRL